MKRSGIFYLCITVLMAMGFSMNTAMASGNGKSNGNKQQAVNCPCSSGVSQLPYQDLSQAEQEGMLKMREEEKLARDVYMYLYDMFQAPVFDKISQSEQRHMDAIKALLDKYGIADPVDAMGPGQFNSPEVQELYLNLTERGSQGLAEALHVGATIEDLDIKDLEALMSSADNDDILTVYQNLVKGSRNHMRAFCSRLADLGISYTAQYLTQEEVDAINATDYERGPVDRKGNPMGGFSSQPDGSMQQGRGNKGSGHQARFWFRRR